MAAKVEEFPHLSFTEIHNQRLLNVASYFIYFINLIGLITTVFLLFMIIRKSSPEMLNFRKYLLGYTVLTIFLEIEFILYKPYAIMPYGIFYPFGLLGFTSPEISVAFMTMEIITIGWILIFILWMTLERYFALKTNKQFYQKPYFYVTYYCIVMGIFMFIILFSIYYIHIFKSPDDVAKIVETYITDGDALIENKNNLFGFPTEKNKLILVWSGYVFLIINTSVVGFTARFLNYRKMIKSKSTLYHRSKPHHVALLRLTLIQNVLYFSLVFIPLLITIISYLIRLPSNIILISLSLVSCFPLCDSVMTLIVIKPYRTALAKLLNIKPKPTVVSIQQ